MAANPTVVFEPELWASIAKEAQRRRKKPQNLVVEVMRDYLEREADLAWWRSVQREYRGRAMSDEQAVAFSRKMRQERALFEKMRASVRGREMTEEEAVEFVHQYRRERRRARSGAARRAHARKGIAPALK